MKRLTGLDRPLLALALCLLALCLIGAIVVRRIDDPMTGVILLLQSIPYAAAAWLVVKRKPESLRGGRALATILIVGLAMRCLLLAGPPVSADIFRYIWDGRVQAAGINPYLHVPADAVLAGLRDGAIYPNIDRANYAPTIYPPAAQIVFFLVTCISERPIAMKAAILAFEALAVWVMLQLLVARGLPATRVLLYAWHPLPLWEFARSGHVDVVAITFLLLAFLAVERRSPLLAGVALGSSVLVKYFHVVAAPALYKRWDWRLPLTFIVTIALLYLPYIAAGPKVFGFLGDYLREEGFDQGSGVFLWQLLNAIVPLPDHGFVVYLALGALLMALLAVGVLKRAEPGADLAGAMLLAGAFIILLSPHYPWYFAWLVPFLCFYPIVGVVYITCAAGLLYFAQSPPTLWEALPIYGPCIVILAAELAWRSRRKLEERDGDVIHA